MVSKDLTFRLFGEDSSASASLRRLSENADRASSRISKSVGASHAAFAGLVAGITTAGLGMLGSAIGAGFDTAKDAIVGFARTGLGEVMDASAGMAQLAAGIKSTGGVAGVSVNHMEDLAGSLQGLSGQTDDSIVSAEQLLLTFTNIRNHGPDKIFDQATRAAADMAAKMGGDASSKAVMLGKALNDPVKGMSALQRVGVSFTAAQKTAVQQMVKTGDTLGAQKVILGELSKEFGGAAKAAGQSLPGQLQRVRRAFEDVSQSVVQKITPIVRPALERIITGIQRTTPFLTKMAGLVAGKVTAAFRDASTPLGKVARLFDALRNATAKGINFQTISAGIQKVFPHFNDLVDVFHVLTPLAPLVGKLLGQIGPDIAKVLPDLAKAAVSLFPALAKIITAILPLVPPLSKVIVALAPVISKVADAAVWLIDNGLTPIINLLADVTGAMSGAMTPMQVLTDGLNGKLGPAAKFISDWMVTLHNSMVDVGAAMSHIGGDIVDGLVGGLKAAWGGITSTLHDLAMQLPEPVRKALDIHSPSRVFHEIGRNVGQGLHNGLLGTKDQIQAASNKLADAVVSAFQSKDIGKSAETAALDALHSGTKRLEDIAKRRAIVATRLTAAKDTLKQALSDRKDYAAGVKSSTVAAGDVTTLGSAGDMVQRLHDLVAHTKTFRTIMGQLAKKGIDRVTYDELAQAGVAGGGLEAAQSLLANPLDFKQVVDLQKQLNAAAGGLGSDTSVHQFRRTLATDRGRVSDLQHLDTAYARQQRTAARSLVRNAERDVHVTVNLSGHVYGSKTELAKAVTDAIRAATRSGAISKNALKV